MKSKSREVEEFFLMKIKAGVLVEKDGEVFNTITKYKYPKPTTNRPHQISLYNKEFRSHVAVTSVSRVLWMIRNKKLVPENTGIRRVNDKLMEFPIDRTKGNHTRTGVKRKIPENVSSKALKKFVDNMHNITSIKAFCEAENLNYVTFHRDLRLMNKLDSVKKETVYLVEGVMQFYEKVKSRKNSVCSFNDAHKLRLEYAKNPIRVSDFAKDNGITISTAHGVLNNKRRFIEGYIKDESVVNAKKMFYEKMKDEKNKIAEDIRHEYIGNPRNVGVFADDMQQKYGIRNNTIYAILNNKIYKECPLAKKCAKVKKKHYSTTRTYQSRKK